FDEPTLELLRWVSERYVAPLAAVIARSHPPRVAAVEEALFGGEGERGAGRSGGRLADSTRSSRALRSARPPRPVPERSVVAGCAPCRRRHVRPPPGAGGRGGGRGAVRGGSARARARRARARSGGRSAPRDRGGSSRGVRRRGRAAPRRQPERPLPQVARGRRRPLCLRRRNPSGGVRSGSESRTRVHLARE